MKILRNLFLVLACLTAVSSQAATASPFGLHFLHKGTPAAPPSGSSSFYDARFGAGNVIANGTPGWFDFPLHSGNHRTYADSVNGNDANTCLSIAQACATFDHTYSVFSSTFTSGGGDQMLVAGGQGQTYTNHATLANGGYMAGKGGISLAYPTVIESYDSTDPTNTAKYGRLVGSAQPVIRLDVTATYGNSFSNAASGSADYVAIVGLSFDGQDADGGADTLWQGTHAGIAFQNNKFSNGATLTLQGGVTYDATAATYTPDINVSKNAFYSQWASCCNIQPIYVHATNRFYLQDNVFWHSGWRRGSARDDLSSIGGANAVNHADYISAINANVRVDRNFYADTSADGLNERGNGIITSNASLDEPIAGNIGAFSGSPAEAPSGILAQVQDWWIGGAADINSTQLRGQGPWTTNTVAGSYMKNIVAIDSPKYGVSSDYFTIAYNNGNSSNISSITHSGTTATVTLASADTYLTTGKHISLGGASPNDYNVVDVPVTVIDSTHFTYATATPPATNATTVGVYTPQVVQYMLFDKVYSFNFARTLDGGQTAFNALNAINNTWTNSITDALAPGAGNQVASSGLFPNYKTRDQVITAVLTGVGITPGATYYIRKGQLLNAALTRPDLPWAQWLIGVGFPAMGLTPTYTTPAYVAFTDTPLPIFVSAMGNLTPSTLNFVHGVSSTVLLTGVSALPVLSSGDLPSGCTLAGRAVTCNAAAGTYTVHVTENSQDGTATPHTTTLTISVS